MMKDRYIRVEITGPIDESPPPNNPNWNTKSRSNSGASTEDRIISHYEVLVINVSCLNYFITHYFITRINWSWQQFRLRVGFRTTLSPESPGRFTSVFPVKVTCPYISHSEWERVLAPSFGRQLQNRFGKSNF